MISKDNRKIIFFDIDGTLIDDTTKLMSESTKAAISRARANGHICLINTGRTKRMVGRDITEQTEFISLQSSPEEWAKEILKYSKGYERKDMTADIVNAGYSIHTEAAKLQKLYLDMADK